MDFEFRPTNPFCAGKSSSATDSIDRGDAPFTYQWTIGNPKLTGATKVTYSVASVNTTPPANIFVKVYGDVEL